MKRKLVAFLMLAVLSIASVFGLTACGNGGGGGDGGTTPPATPPANPPQQPSYSQGLEFTLNGEGTGYILTGFGTWTVAADLVIPSQYQGKPVVAIEQLTGDNGNSTIKRITIPNTVVRIEDKAFFRLDAVEKLDIPDSVEYIGAQAFNYMSNALTEVRLGSGIKFIGANAFNNATLLVDVYYDGTVADWLKVDVDETAWNACVALEGIICTDDFYQFGL